MINDNSIQFGTAGGNDTQDKVFLLAESDVWNTDKAVSHGFSKAYNDYDKARRSYSTTYAKAMGTYSRTDYVYAGNCYWWLRSPGYNNSSETFIMYGGSVNTTGFSVNNFEVGVRPALYLNLSSQVWSNAGTVSSEVKITSQTDTQKELRKPAVKKLSKSYVKVFWNSIPGERGYEIARSKCSSEKFNVVKRVSYKYKSTIIKTPRNVKYYYKIRAYKTVSGKRVYGPWSSVVSYTLR